MPVGMAMTTLCTVLASLRVLPNKSQFFPYESVSLSCEQQGGPSAWTVKMNTSSHVNENCEKTDFPAWNDSMGSHCSIPDLYVFDSGVYWCESASGCCSDAVHITVTGAPVILEVPVLPVPEGDAVTLSCKNGNASSPGGSSDFFKDGRRIGSSPTGRLTLRGVSRAHAGLYGCNVSGAGGSPHSRLTVGGRRPPPPPPPPPGLPPALLPVALGCLSLVAVMLLCLWRSHKGKVDADVCYTDVIITPQVQPKRSRDVDVVPTIYSTVKPGNT